MLSCSVGGAWCLGWPSHLGKDPGPSLPCLSGLPAPGPSVLGTQPLDTAFATLHLVCPPASRLRASVPAALTLLLARALRRRVCLCAECWRRLLGPGQYRLTLLQPSGTLLGVRDHLHSDPGRTHSVCQLYPDPLCRTATQVGPLCMDTGSGDWGSCAPPTTPVRSCPPDSVLWGEFFRSSFIEDFIHLSVF